MIRHIQKLWYRVINVRFYVLNLKIVVSFSFYFQLDFSVFFDYLIFFLKISIRDRKIFIAFLSFALKLQIRLQNMSRSTYDHYSFHKVFNNEAPSNVKATLVGSTYPGWKMFHFGGYIFFLLKKTLEAKSGTSAATYKVMKPHCGKLGIFH